MEKVAIYKVTENKKIAKEFDYNRIAQAYLHMED